MIEPEGTQAFAFLEHDPDAPTGSGWWHWQIINISAKVTTLESGAGDASGELKPEGSVQIGNDNAVKGFGGACPPVDHGDHRNQFTLHALSQKLELPEETSGALTG